MRNLKFIWDFRGPDAEHIAKHHLIHLKEYVAIEQLNITIFDVQQLSEMHWIAFMVVPESIMKTLRDALKPHRGQVYQDK